MSKSQKKRVLMLGRVRRMPPSGWSWIDGRFLREHAAALGREAITLYFFLAAVADRDGVSFYSDASTAAVLRLSPAQVASARNELVARDLVAYDAPTAQVLSMPVPTRRAPSSPVAIGDLLRRLAGGEQ